HDPLYKCLQEIKMKPGTMVIWDSSGCHANYPNSSSSMRIVQYIRMMPKNTLGQAGHRLKKPPSYYYEKNWNDPTLRDALSRLDKRELNLLGFTDEKDILSNNMKIYL